MNRNRSYDGDKPQDDEIAGQYDMRVETAEALLEPMARPVRDGAWSGLRPLRLGWERLRAIGGEALHSLGVETVRVSRESGRWRLTLHAPDSIPVSLLDLLHYAPSLPPTTALLGLSLEGQPVVLDLGQDDVSHVLVCGQENAGKTTLLQSMILSLALANRQAQMQLLLIDHAPRDDLRELSAWQSFNQLPHLLAPLLRQVAETADSLAFLEEEIAHRQRQGVKTPAIVVTIDRLVSLLEDGGQPMLDTLLQVAQSGADAGIYLLTATRRPDSPLIDSLLRTDLNLRIVGQVADARIARAATGLPDSQAEYLMGGGDFLAVAGEDVVQFQAAACTNSETDKILRQIGGKRRPTLLAHPLSVQSYLAADL